MPITVKRDRRTIQATLLLGPPERFEYRIEEKEGRNTATEGFARSVVEWRVIPSLDRPPRRWDCFVTRFFHHPRSGCQHKSRTPAGLLAGDPPWVERSEAPDTSVSGSASHEVGDGAQPSRSCLRFAVARSTGSGVLLQQPGVPLALHPRLYSRPLRGLKQNQRDLNLIRAS